MLADGHKGKAVCSNATLFATTHWSVVLAAGQGDSAEAAEALEKLCLTYWYPLYAFVRRRGYAPEDAQDLTQEFLARLLATHALGSVSPGKGRFRTFLLAAFNHFLANEWDKAHALKRGGGHTIISLDEAETRYGAEPSDSFSPDRLYERQWVITLLALAASRLGEDYQSAGKRPLFNSLRIYLTGEKRVPPYQEVADEMGMSVDAVKKAVERLRRRYGEVLREEIAQTISDPVEVDEEIRYLRTALSAP